jgi:hypothetical protein
MPQVLTFKELEATRVPKNLGPMFALQNTLGGLFLDMVRIIRIGSGQGELTKAETCYEY